MYDWPKGMQLICSDLDYTKSADYIFLGLSYSDMDKFFRFMREDVSIDNIHFPIGNLIINRLSGQLIYRKERFDENNPFMGFVPGEDAWYFINQPERTFMDSHKHIPLRKMKLPDMVEETVMEIPKGELFTFDFYRKPYISPEGNSLVFRFEYDKYSLPLFRFLYRELSSSFKEMFNKKEKAEREKWVNNKDHRYKLTVINNFKMVHEINHLNYPYCGWIDESHLMYKTGNELFTAGFPDFIPDRIELPYDGSPSFSILEEGWASICSSNKKFMEEPPKIKMCKQFIYSLRDNRLIPFDCQKHRGSLIRYNSDRFIINTLEKSKDGRMKTYITIFSTTTGKAIERKSFDGNTTGDFYKNRTLIYKLPDKEETYLLSLIDLNELKQRNLLLFRTIDYRDIEILNTFKKGSSSEGEAT